MFDLQAHRFTFSDYAYDFPVARLEVEGEAMIFHCHHYNCFLQRSILDADYIDSVPHLVGAAAEVAHRQLTGLFARLPDLASRRAAAEELYRLSGFGLLPLAGLSAAGGLVSTASTHYSTGWKEKFGPADRPVAHFSTGFLAGAYAALFDVPLREVRAEQTACRSMGSSEDVFVVSRGQGNFAVYAPRRPLVLAPPPAESEIATGVDRQAITRAIAGMPIAGDGRGLIPAFGVLLTRMYADYYNRISFEFENQLKEVTGAQGLEVARSLLVEAGHVCAFNTFGGIMTSTEWDAMILPSLTTREDWVAAVLAVANAFGWGVWRAIEVTPERGLFRVYNDYESVGYQRMYRSSDHPISYLATGGAAGLMNLVYVGDISSRPELTEGFYNQLFKGPNVFVARQTRCQAQGDPYSEFEAVRT